MPVQELFRTLYETYGPVCYVPTPFGRAYVMISGNDAVREALTHEDLNWKYPARVRRIEPFNKLLGATGVINASGDTWKEHRKLSLTVLRGFGVGKRSFEDQIASESECLMQEITALDGRPFNPSLLLRNAVSNVICSVVFGKRFGYYDREFLDLLYLLEDSIGHFIVDTFLSMMPFLYKVPFFPKGGIPSLKRLRMYCKDVVSSHRDTYDDENTRDFIDAFLKELKLKNEQNIDTHVTDESLVVVVHDIFFAGTETTSNTLCWALLFMLKCPDVQARVHVEIDSVVGRHRLPQLSDKPDMPYTEAVIREVQRYASIAFVAPPRISQTDVEFRGYTIPKGTTVFSTLYTATRDTSVWNDPDGFKPERFLDEDGRLDTAQQIVFGAGKRLCLGEQLARMELFILYSHLMHRYSFKKPKDVTNLDLRHKTGGVLTPYPYELCACVR